MIEESWKTAFRILSEQTDPTMKITSKDIEEWTISKISLLNEQTSQIFSQYDTAKRGVCFFVIMQFIEFQGFRDFVLNSGINEIKA